MNRLQYCISRPLCAHDVLLAFLSMKNPLPMLLLYTDTVFVMVCCAWIQCQFKVSNADHPMPPPTQNTIILLLKTNDFSSPAMFFLIVYLTGIVCKLQQRGLQLEKNNDFSQKHWCCAPEPLLLKNQKLPFFKFIMSCKKSVFIHPCPSLCIGFLIIIFKIMFSPSDI
jgi:hypothetical protein